MADMTFEEFCASYHNMILGYYLLMKWFPGKMDLEVPYPSSQLNDDELAELTTRLRDCMPLNTLITDLWDWDVRFEKELGNEWFFEAAFGISSSLDQASNDLAEFFLHEVEDLSLDYGVNNEFFEDLVKEEAKKFVEQWRKNMS